MKAKDHTLCKLVKEGFLDEEPAQYRALVQGAAHVCRKCGRAARDPERLCKPRPLDEAPNP